MNELSNKKKVNKQWNQRDSNGRFRKKLNKREEAWQLEGKEQLSRIEISKNGSILNNKYSYFRKR